MKEDKVTAIKFAEWILEIDNNELSPKNLAIYSYLNNDNTNIHELSKELWDIYCKTLDV